MRVWSLRWRSTGGRISPRPFLASVALVGLMGAAVTQQTASAQSATSTGTYEVVVTDLTGGQPMSGPVLATHGDGLELFAVGEPASHGVVQVVVEHPGVQAGVGDLGSRAPAAQGPATTTCSGGTSRSRSRPSASGGWAEGHGGADG